MLDAGNQQRDQDALLHVGDVVGTHGLRGDLKVKSHSGDLSALLTVQEVILDPAVGPAFTARISRQILHKKMVLMRLTDYESIALAEPLIGSKVMLPESSLPELDEDEYYWSKLSGSRVSDRRFGDLGHLVSMFTTAAHDTYVVEGPYGEVLIPAVKTFILSIDLDQKVIEVDLPAGLVPRKE